MNGFLKMLLLVLLILAAAACSDEDRPVAASDGDGDGVPTYTYTVINTYPHDSGAYTQGLQYVDGVLYEGTGLYNPASTLRKVELETGAVLQSIDIGRFFGEGITVVGDEIYQLTWLDKFGFVWNKSDFQELRRFTYPTQGWGLTYDGTELIMSDGTANLYFRDPATFAETRRVTVRDENGDPVTLLNELEYIGTEVFANVWKTDLIVRISPADGDVVGWVDLSGLSPIVGPPGERVLNGIAYDAAGDRLFVTGKLWPQLYEIELSTVESPARVR